MSLRSFFRSGIRNHRTAFAAVRRQGPRRGSRRFAQETLEPRLPLAVGDLLINEVHFDPTFGNSDFDQYLEFRGAPGATIQQGTYLVVIDGDQRESGDVHVVLDLSGITLGANGYLAITQFGSGYTVDPQATLLTGESKAFDLPDGRFQSDSPFSDRIDFIFGSNTFLLVEAATAPQLTDEVDVNDDGILDGAALGWTIIDSVAVARGGTNYSYAAITFAVEDTTLIAPNSTTIVPIKAVDYVGRIGDSTGSRAEDWVGSVTVEGERDSYEFHLNFGLFGEAVPRAFTGRQLDHLGSTNFLGSIHGAIAGPANAGVTVFLDRNENGEFDFIETRVDADAFPDGTPLTNAFDGVTLGTTVDDSHEGRFEVFATNNAANATTGPRTFSHAGIGFFDDSRRLRMDFYKPAQAISIDFINRSGLSLATGRLEAYSLDGTLLATYLTEPFMSGFRTMGITRPTADIAFAIAYSDPSGSPFGSLDNLQFIHPEDSAQTAADGTYRIDRLFDGEYTVAEIVPDGAVQTAPAVGVHQVEIVDSAPVLGADFAHQAAAPLNVAASAAPLVEFEQPIFQFSERGEALNTPITLRRTLDTSAASTVRVTPVSDSATAGEDFAAAAIDVEFAPGEETKVVEIPLTADAIIENDESLSLLIEPLTNAALGNLAAATLIIRDDDEGVLRFESKSGFEDTVGTLDFVVSQSHAVDGPFELAYATAPASSLPATAEVDYESTAGTLAFSGSAGSSDTISVPVTPDLVYEADERFEFLLPDLQPRVHRLRHSSAAQGIIRNDDPLPFTVNAVVPLANGVQIRLSKSVVVDQLDLFMGESPNGPTPDVLLVGDTVGPVVGSLVYDDATKTLSFVTSAGALAPDTYTLTLRSAADGMIDTEGLLLDGDVDGVAGGDFVHEFVVGQATGRTLSVPGFATGPGEEIEFGSRPGLPVRIDDADGVTHFSFELNYDLDLLNVTGGTLAASMPDDWSFQVFLLPSGMAMIEASGSPLPAGPRELARLLGDVPDDAPVGAVQLIHFSAVTLNQGQLEVRGHDAIHTVVNPGDATGEGGYSAFDAALIARIAVHLDGVFENFPHLDPIILGDLTGDGTLSALDASYVARRAVGLSELPNPVPPALPNVAPTNGAPTALWWVDDREEASDEPVATGADASVVATAPATLAEAELLDANTDEQAFRTAADALFQQAGEAEGSEAVAVALDAGADE
ncbi:MAG: hypothetical protein KDA42_05280 [Planctomycetales bacterium]|nr:hypothetical protein [Planctomycetales bacterium]